MYKTSGMRLIFLNFPLFGNISFCQTLSNESIFWIVTYRILVFHYFQATYEIPGKIIQQFSSYGNIAMYTIKFPLYLLRLRSRESGQNWERSSTSSVSILTDVKKLKLVVKNLKNFFRSKVVNYQSTKRQRVWWGCEKYWMS